MVPGLYSTLSFSALQTSPRLTSCRCSCRSSDHCPFSRNSAVEGRWRRAAVGRPANKDADIGRFCGVVKSPTFTRISPSLLFCCQCPAGCNCTPGGPLSSISTFLDTPSRFWVRGSPSIPRGPLSFLSIIPPYPCTPSASVRKEPKGLSIPFSTTMSVKFLRLVSNPTLGLRSEGWYRDKASRLAIVAELAALSLQPRSPYTSLLRWYSLYHSAGLVRAGGREALGGSLFESACQHVCKLYVRTSTMAYALSR